MIYTTGWRKGAALAAIADQEHDDPDFCAGWEAGRRAKRDAYASACQRYGATLNVYRTCGETPAGED